MEHRVQRNMQDTSMQMRTTNSSFIAVDAVTESSAVDC